MAFSQLWRYRRLAGLFFTAASSARAFCKAGDGARALAAVVPFPALAALFPVASAGQSSIAAARSATGTSRGLEVSRDMDQVQPTAADIAIQFSV
jgi:hypothetical protein